MLFLSVGLVVLAVLLLRRRLPGVASAATLASLVLALLLASSFWFISNLLTGRGIDESVVYHLRTDLTGAAFSDFLGPIALGIVLVGVSVGLAFLVYREARTPVVAVHGRVPQIAALTSLIAACYFNPAVTDMRAMYAEEIPDPVANAQTSSAAQKALARIRFPARKKNLVVLYLESFERTLLDPKLFPGLAPHLAALEEQGLSFSNIGQFYGDGWTIAGMVSSQCGVPLALPTDQGNAMSGMNTFLPGATCLGDILRFSGYQMEFMGGADLDFAGKGSFYRTHGFARVEGWNELKSRLRDPRYQHQWGLHDDTLIDLLKNRFDKLASGTLPFGLFALTVNTHHPKGIVAAPCIDVRYEDGRDPVLNAMHCADRMVHEFVTYLQKHPAYEDTVIVLASDHLALPNTASHRLEQGNRKNLLLVLAKDLAPRRVETPGALFDVAPTLLGVLGAEGGGALGYGRDLLGAKPSLAGSMANLKAYLRSRRREDNRLWQFPQLTRGMKVDARKALIALDGSSVRAPALLLLDSALGVQGIKFQHRRWKLIDRVAALPFAQEFIWVDQCAKVYALSAGRGLDQESPFCVALGSLGAKTIHVTSIGESMDMTLEEIQETRDSTPPVRKLAAKRVSALRKASLYGMTPPPLHVLEPDLEGSHLAVSTAQRGAKSFVDNPETPQALSLERGLTLFGLNEDAGPVVLSHWDTCADGVDEAALAGYSFQKDIGRLRAHFGAFIVMAHDSAVCGKRDLAGLFAGSRFREWRDIGFRTPYLGVVTASGKTHEFTGDVDEEIAVELGGLFGRDRKKTTFMQRQSAHLPRVAHAGGAYEGQTYTNSLDALDLNRDRYQLFEIDLSWTSDGHLVCLHDWKASWGKDEEKKDSLEVFLRTSARRKGPAGCTLETLADWMRSNPSASIVTDVKEDNIRALAKIAHDHPALKPRFIPQIYTPAEYRVARSLGFEDIIWTLYRMHIPEKQILGHLRYMDLFALTMPVRRAETGLAKRAAEATGVLSYVHTLNSAEEFEHFRALGVNSLYTDFLSETEAPTR